MIVPAGAAGVGRVTSPLYLGWLRDQGRVAQTLRARAAAIAFYHRQAELHSPCDHKFVKDVLEGASRKDAGREHGRATVTLEDLEKLLLRLPVPQTLLEKRDLAITLLTFATSRRRSEIAALDLSHLDFSRREFLFIRIAKSKSNQRGVGMNVGVPRLSEHLRRVWAVHAIEDWLDSGGVRIAGKIVGSGAHFRAFSIDGDLQDHRIEPRVVAAVFKKLYARPASRRSTSRRSQRTRYAEALSRAWMLRARPLLRSWPLEGFFILPVGRFRWSGNARRYGTIREWQRFLFTRRTSPKSIGYTTSGGSTYREGSSAGRR